MLKKLANALTVCKDGAVEAAGKAFINQQIEKFGVVTKLQLDSRQKSISAELALKGEASPVVIRVDSYEVLQRADGTYIAIRSVHASREWISALLSELLVGRQFGIPRVVGMAL
jgi:hypothetical protein